MECIGHRTRITIINIDTSGSSFAVAAYVTSYISKVDKFSNVGWKDVMRELDAQIKSAVTLNEGR